MVGQPLELFAIVLGIAITAVGSPFQASVGIGLALLVVPLLAMIDQSFIPERMLLASVNLTVMTAYRVRKAIDVAALFSSLRRFERRALEPPLSTAA